MIQGTTITPMARQDAKRFRDVCCAAGYTEKRLRDATGLLVPPPTERVPPAVLEALLDGASPFHFLARLFFFGLPVDAHEASAALPTEFIRACLDCGLVAKDVDVLRPVALVVPVGDAFLASDLQVTAWQDEEHYVPPVCDAALHLASVAIRTPVKRMLDLCGGFALHGIISSPFCEEVVTTDLNPRAEAFALFNAALNECDNFKAVTGDMFDAVEGQRFDRILSNPPFIITPESATTFRFTPHELDGFIHRMLSEAPQYLNDGGVMQTICEWVEIDGQEWQERLRGWFDGNGCDVWILPANRQLPSTYANVVLRQTIADESQLASHQQEWTDYFHSQSVVAIHGGFIFFRRRQGKNWFDVTQLTKPIRDSIGDAIVQGFRGRDRVFDESGDDSLLAERLRVAEGLRQVEYSHWKEFRWQRDSITLHVDNGVPVTIGIDEYVRCLLEKFDGRRAVAACLDLFAEEVGLPSESGRKQGLQIIHSMIRNGVLVVPT
ncbi:MAG: methyltransferase [Planctomycetales bacterium]|nr:methyltransferase [Planctomycetales bacterium]